MDCKMNSFFFTFGAIFFLTGVHCHEEKRGKAISYTREQLFDIKQHGEGKTDIDILPPEIREQLGHKFQWRDQLRRRRRKRGKRGGIWRKLQRRKTKLPLPTILLANVRSLRNRIDELNTNIRFLKEYRGCVYLVFYGNMAI